MTKESVGAPTPKNKALGDSPNPFFNVWRSYSEPGGIADEMRALAAANPELMKLENLGTTKLGKPILAIKMTADARNVKDGARPALLFSAINHAREWVAAEQGRRLPGGSRSTRTTRRSRRSSPTRSLVPADPEHRRLRLHLHLRLGADQVPCDYRNPPAGKATNRFWRKTLRQQQQQRHLGQQRRRRRPNRNYPAKRAIDEEGASNSIGGETYRGLRTRSRRPATWRSTGSSAA